MEPDKLSGGLNRTGWVDISSGLQAFKRSNGEYLVFVEDDMLARVILYRWCPTGDCVEPQVYPVNNRITPRPHMLSLPAGTGNGFDLQGRLVCRNAGQLRRGALFSGGVVVARTAKGTAIKYVKVAPVD
jgi:hypothetical protein